MAIDPVCGMRIDEQTALRSTYQGKPYYFCSSQCKETFDLSPERYAKRAAEEPVKR